MCWEWPTLFTSSFPFYTLPESLHIYNFGYERSLPLPSVSVDLGRRVTFNLQHSGLQTPTRRSIEVIGGKYVQVGHMEVVDKIHRDTQGLPFTIFIDTEKEIKINNTSSHTTPALVGMRFSLIPIHINIISNQCSGSYSKKKGQERICVQTEMRGDLQ